MKIIIDIVNLLVKYLEPELNPKQASLDNSILKSNEQKNLHKSNKQSIL